MNPYSDTYYDRLKQSSRRSAEIVVPMIVEMVNPTSVVDLGCGRGTWLDVFKASGVQEVLGIDGAYISPDTLEIAPQEFMACDLAQRLNIGRRFDLAMSLEVAEHLGPQVAKDHIAELTDLAPVVLFSAAIPHQGGEHHVNEQWPEFWASLFRERGYVAIDCLRHRIWANEEVDWRYTQNMMVFCTAEMLDQHPLLKDHQLPSVAKGLALVHPRNYLQKVWRSRVLQAAIAVADVIPADRPLILVDQNSFGEFPNDRREVVPFLVRDGQYAGPPENDSQAIEELERLHDRGIRHIVFGWPSFWWFDHYGEFHSYLESEHDCILRNKDVVVFELK